MSKLRTDVASYVRACERLIFSATMDDQPKFTDHEAQVVAYYTGQIAKITETGTQTATGHAMQLDIESVLAPLDTGAESARSQSLTTSGRAATPSASDKSP